MSRGAADHDPITAAGDPRRILAMGGGGFTMEERSPALDRFVLTLARNRVPRICFLPTASGDPREQVTRFYERFRDWPCEPSTLSLFHLGRDRIDPVAHLLSQDIVYVGGGSMRNMLAIWREHALDEAMHTAWQRGIVLAGLSAGAMCWFQGGISMSGGAPEAVRGLGLLAGSLSVHLDGEPERLPAYHSAVAGGELPAGWAADDGAALLFAGGALLECVASRVEARVTRVVADRAGGVREHLLAVRRLAGATGIGAASAAVSGALPAPSLAHQDAAIAELRGLRAGRHRWD